MIATQFDICYHCGPEYVGAFIFFAVAFLFFRLGTWLWKKEAPKAIYLRKTGAVSSYAVAALLAYAAWRIL